MTAPDKIEEWSEAFWANVTASDPNECWPWQAGSKGGRGYGYARVKGASMGAHRVSWLLHTGKMPRAGFVIMHKCDNPICANPHHLREGTQSENMQDCVAKGRHVPFIAFKDECKNGHKFTPENTAIVTTNGRPAKRCRTCSRATNRKWAQEKRAENHV